MARGGLSTKAYWVLYFLVVVVNCKPGESLPIGIPPGVDKIRFNKTTIRDFHLSSSSSNDTVDHRICRIYPTEKGIHNTIADLLVAAKLIEYKFSVRGYEVNPLSVNNTWSYKAESWARVASSHGQVILNLAFNYGILSLMTLRFGTVDMQIEIEDDPPGCLGCLREQDKILVVLDLALRDLNPSGPIVVSEGQASVCFQWIVETDGRAKFTDRCCYESDDGDHIECLTDITNKWLNILDILLGTLTICVFVFGPLMLPDWVYTAAMDTEKYYVKLKEPLYKTMAVSRRFDASSITAKHVLDFRNRQDFRRARRIITELPSEVIIPMKISQFDINVNYKKLLCENKVHVGILKSLSRAVFLCKLRDVDAFADCCNAKVLGCLSKPSAKRHGETDRSTWIYMCNILGRLLLVVFLLLPFYIRLIVYYVFEDPEIQSRQKAAEALGLPLYYNYRLLQYLTPTHPLYIVIYIIYFIAGSVVAYFSGTEKKTRFQQTIMDAFADMNSLSMLKALGMVVYNCLWPFSKYGIFGIFVGVIFWPVIMPVSLALCGIYCLPIVFISCRIILHTILAEEETEVDDRNKPKPSPQSFHAKALLTRLKSVRERRRVQEHFSYWNPKLAKMLKNGFLSGSAIVTLCAVMILLAEVISFLVEVMCFTMMGIIVNASAVLKYGTLLFLVVLYSYDSYNNVTKKYLKLNKAIFSEIKNRLGKDIDQYTQLPSHIQENRGFKTAEASEQAVYEMTEDISATNCFVWTINDLILFIDKEDCPRIPKRLFDLICQVKVAGSPGPVYLSLIAATKKFLVIVMFLLFVFIVVLSFGESYKMSQTNQMLATMAGGFMPFMFRNIFRPGKAEVETNLLTFRSKIEEIIKNYYQEWPMYDLTFEVEAEPGDNESQGGDDNESFKSSKAPVGEEHKTGEEKKASPDKTQKDKKDSKGDWLDLLKPMTSQTISTWDLRETVENMEFVPAEGREVDVLIYVTERDHNWTYEVSSISDFQDALTTLESGDGATFNPEIPMIKINGTIPHASESDGFSHRANKSPRQSRRNSLVDKQETGLLAV